jgi:hypothetical protein
MLSEEEQKAIFEEVAKCVEEIKGVPFDKGLPGFQKALWDIGDKHGINGDEVLKIYFEKRPK